MIWLVAGIAGKAAALQLIIAASAVLHCTPAVGTIIAPVKLTGGDGRAVEYALSGTLAPYLEVENDALVVKVVFPRSLCGSKSRLTVEAAER